MNKESAIKKINTIGKVGSIISTICIVISCIGLVGVLVGGIFCRVLPQDTFKFTFGNTAVLNADVAAAKGMGFFPNGLEEPSRSFSQGTMSLNGTIYVPENVNIDGDRVTADFVAEEGMINPARVSTICFVMAAFVVMCIFLLFLVRRLCKALESCESPFEASVVKGVEQCTWSLIVWTILGGIATGIIMTVSSGTVNLGFSFGLPTVLELLLIFGLGYIFKYGAQLQTESDETL